MADGIERSASAPTRSSADLRGLVQVDVRFARADEFRPVAHPRVLVRLRRRLVRRDRLVQRRGGGVELDLRVLISFLPE
jgi:hypothetical protein